MDILAKLSAANWIAIWAIIVSAAIGLAAVIGGIIKYFRPAKRNGNGPAQPPSGSGPTIGVRDIQAEKVEIHQVHGADALLLKQLEQRVGELENALKTRIPPVKTTNDARQPFSAEQKAEYEQISAELEQQTRLASEKFKKDLRISIDAQVSHASGLLRLGKYRQAEQAYRTILTGHPDANDAIAGLGITLFELAKYPEAEEIFNSALAQDEASLGPDHPSVATDLNNLAELLRATNRLSEAEPLYRRALKIDEASFGLDHPEVATDLNNLAQLYQATNRLDEAEPLMQRALKIDEASLGKNHPGVAIDLNNLAALYQATNRLAEAEPLMQRALKIDEASLGKDHPDVARDLNNLAALYQATNRLKEAEPLMQRALKIDEASLGKDHPSVAIRLNNLAALYQATNRLAEAEPLMERHLVIFLKFTRRTGHPHPHLDDAVKNYAALLIQMGHSRNEVNDRLKRLAPDLLVP